MARLIFIKSILNQYSGALIDKVLLLFAQGIPKLTWSLSWVLEVQSAPYFTWGARANQA